MMHDILSLIGLCLRAGKLVCGDDMVAAAVDGGEARLLLLAQDAGAGIRRKAAYFAQKGTPVITLTGCSAEEIGAALGRRPTAICCMTDIGFAASAAKKAAEKDEAYAQTAVLLSDKNKRIQSRRGLKKNRKNTVGSKKSGGSKKNHTKRGGERA